MPAFGSLPHHLLCKSTSFNVSRVALQKHQVIAATVGRSNLTCCTFVEWRAHIACTHAQYGTHHSLRRVPAHTSAIHAPAVSRSGTRSHAGLAVRSGPSRAQCGVPPRQCTGIAVTMNLSNLVEEYRTQLRRRWAV
jgi:hypothetical protein